VELRFDFLVGLLLQVKVTQVSVELLDVVFTLFEVE
jgi:hypothetical protein